MAVCEPPSLAQGETFNISGLNRPDYMLEDFYCALAEPEALRLKVPRSHVPNEELGCLAGGTHHETAFHQMRQMWEAPSLTSCFATCCVPLIAFPYVGVPNCAFRHLQGLSCDSEWL